MAQSWWLQEVSISEPSSTSTPVPAPMGQPAGPQKSILPATTSSEPSSTSIRSSPAATDEGTTPSPPSYLPAKSPPPPPLLQPMKKPTLEQIKKQNATRHQAALDCELSSWSDWSVCADTQNGLPGQLSTRTRAMVQPQRKGGSACPNDSMQQIPCPAEQE